MITINLSEEEAAILHGIIESFIDETRMEIRHTDNREFREILVKQEELVKRLLHELEIAGVKKEIA
jgi:hypothetical protein